MGKLSKKLSIYLDQNFLSEIAKCDTHEKVNPKFKKLYELIHIGFLEEKLIVPRSFFHKVESSGIKILENKISSFQGYMGQIELQQKEIIELWELEQAMKSFMGIQVSPIHYINIYKDDPDKRITHLDVNVKMSAFYDYFRGRYSLTTTDLSNLQKKINKNTFTKQYKLELQACRETSLKYKKDLYKRNFGKVEDVNKIKDFLFSQTFEQIPNMNIFCKLWSALFTDFRNRKIGTGDYVDTNVISAYLPYVDVFTSDKFMVNLIKRFKFDEQYKTKVFSPENNNINGLDAFIDFLDKYLKNTTPVNKPIVSIFVFSDDEIKEKSFDFFKTLGNQSMRDRLGWVEIFGIDDGNMPEYPDSRIKTTLPFYGFQEINVIKTHDISTIEQRLKICRENCRSDKFLIIDHYRKLPENFIETLVDYTKNNNDRIMSFPLCDK